MSLIGAMYSVNKMGPSMLPWGTPWLSTVGSDVADVPSVWTITFCFLLVR